MATNQEDVIDRDAKLENDRRDGVAAIIGRLEQEVEARIGKRSIIEERWLEDLRRYHGSYDEAIQKDLKQAKKSSLFINQTRPKTNAMEARLSDMLFPTDENNWGIKPTPVPELTLGAKQAAQRAAKTATALVENPADPKLQETAIATQQTLDELKKQMDEARTRAEAMEAEIEDHLRECDYGAECREVIRDSCRLGTGILKGPMTDGKSRRSWAQPMEKQEDGSFTKSNVYQLKYAADQRPTFYRVDPWNFFPDMDVAKMEDSQGDYERHLLNPKQLRKLARNPTFNQNAIRTLLKLPPSEAAPSYLNDLRSITSSYNDLAGDRYHVFEYHGTITAEEMLEISKVPGFEEYAEDIEYDKNGDIDPLAEMNVVIWFCQGELLKFGIHSLDSGDSIYSVFNLERDETSVFGFGIPYLMRDSQKALAAAWRTLLDNMGLSSGPQIVINDDTLEPVDGNWELVGRKLWRRKGTAPPDKKPFETFNIESHLEELQAVIEMCKKNIDEETALPVIAQGDQTSQVTKTLGGMSILMNAVNVVFRRIVKNWDDQITDPAITRFYDWLMQFSTKEHIKGDYQIDARGTSVLLVREMQSANLMAFVLNFGAHPILGKYLKKNGLPALRRLAQVLMIPPDEVLKTDTEIAEQEAEEAKTPPAPPPEVQKQIAMLEGKRVDADKAVQIALINRETKMMELAQTSNMTIEEIAADLIKSREAIASKERIFAAEAAVEQSQPKNEPGSGGYIS